MSEVITKAVEALQEKLGSGFDGSVKFTIEGEGSIMVDQSGVRAADEDAACTMTADVDTFEGILDGSENPTAAFMAGKLVVDGDMAVAMQLGSALS
ncbi:MAG: SCP2 sterol-binding domain-containing protein [Litoreibacter sp.]